MDGNTEDGARDDETGGWLPSRRNPRRLPETRRASRQRLDESWGRDNGRCKCLVDLWLQVVYTQVEDTAWGEVRGWKRVETDGRLFMGSGLKIKSRMGWESMDVTPNSGAWR